MTVIDHRPVTAPTTIGSAGAAAAAARPLPRLTPAERRRREALARLSARVMPLPGQPLYAAPPVQRLPEPAAPALPRPSLTDREVQVLRSWLLLDSKPAVADDLEISLGTVNTHLTRIRAKYSQIGRSAPTKAALVARAIQDELVDIDEL
ncbi:helix-turn-helix transcriptional regulator [Gordonia sp. VNK21]|uniref:helix-turn-helix transcriptional regulator n=1 Tax=Gordonia sp. VNK21 TaxID=3382483 RepID=UPI0038D4BF22